jgi:hypothetical protein
MVYDLETRFGFFEEIEDFYTGDHRGPTYEIEGNSLSLCVTDCHTMPYTTNGNPKSKRADDLCGFKDAQLPTACTYIGGSPKKHVQLIAAFQADGSIHHKQIRWHFKKERKIQRLLMLLREAGMEHSMSRYKDGSTHISTKGDIAQKWFGFKKAGAYLLEWDAQSLKLFLEEHAYWDGYLKPDGSFEVSAVNREHLDWLATVSKLVQKGYTWNKVRTSGYGSIVHSVKFNNRTYASKSSLDKFELSNLRLNRDKLVYCPVTSTGFFMVRRNGKISVTGNSSYLMGWVTMGETVLKHSLHSLPLDLSSASPLILKKKNIEKIQDAFFSRWKGVKKWHEAVSKNLLDNGYAQTSVGHRRTFMGRKAEYRQGAKLANRETLKEALSTLPQFYTTYATKLALWMLWFDPENRTEEGDLKLEPILCVHDSLLGQAKDVYEEWAKARIKTYFDNEIEIAGMPITIPAEGTIGRDWGMKDEVII